MIPSTSVQDPSGRALPRRWLAALLVLGLAGSGAELILLEHTEGLWQKVPFGVIALSFIALGAAAARPRRACLRAFQGAMLLLLAAGLVGLGLHFNGNREFELEMHPDHTGWPLVWATLKGATPALAPGLLVMLALLGFAWTYGHPALHSIRQIERTQTQPSPQTSLIQS